MGRLTCRCLNVAVHYKGDSWNARPLDGGKVLPSACSHRLCAATLYEIDLDLAGVTTEQSSLLLTQGLGDWVVQHCSNCGTDVCVTHRKKSRAFVCAGLLATEEDFSQVKGHPHYSSVFRIALNPNMEEEEIVGRRRVSSMSFGRDDPSVRLAHTQVKGFLAREEEEVEKKIREFERRERDSFARLQQRTFTERTLLFAAIAKAKESAAAEGVSDHSHSHSSRPPIHSSPLLQLTQQQKEKVTITLRDPRPTTDKAPVDDSLFSLDGFDEDGEEEVDGEKGGVAFPQSDDEEISTDDSSYRDMSSVQPAIASSAPLSVPMFKPSEQQTPSFDRELPPTDMASSIKALALSVQDTGMFGDLPRPRVNSITKYK